jgi:hypothetical protein
MHTIVIASGYVRVFTSVLRMPTTVSASCMVRKEMMYVAVILWQITVAARSKASLSSLALTLGSWVRIPLKAWIFVCVYSMFVLS